jgi:hypothetical protein
MPTLVVQLPGLPPVSHVIRDETTTIGRLKSNSVVIDDSSVSLMHAKITRKNGDYYLKDLNSTNGTNVNGQVIAEAKLRDQDRVRIAEVSTQFLAEPVLEVLNSMGVGFPVQAGVSAAAPVAAAAPVSVTPTAPIAAQVLGMVGSLSSSKSEAAPGTTVAAVHPLQAASAGIPAGGTTLVRVRERPKSHFGVLIGAMAGALSVLAVISFLAWKFFNLGSANDQDNAANKVAAREKGATVQKHASAAPSNADSSTASARDSSNRPLSPQSAMSDNPLELAILLKSQDVTMRRQAARSLHALGPEASKAAAELHEAVADPDEEVRMWSALALVNSQEYDKRAVPILVHVLKNENSVLRQVACLSLGLVPYEDKDKEIVVPALAEIAGRDTDEDVRKAAKSALNIIAPDVYGKDKDVVH